MTKTHTSLRLSREEMVTMLTMLNITTELVSVADKDDFATVGNFTVRKTSLERLYTLTIEL